MAKIKTESLQVMEQSTDQIVLSGQTNLIELAIKSGASIDTIERLVALYDRERKERAKNAFFAALSEFQSEVPVIKRNKEGYKGEYTYAELDQIVSAIRAPMKKHGFSHTYKFKDVKKESFEPDITAILEAARKYDPTKQKISVLEKALREIMSAKDIEVTCVITHIGGHSEETTMVGPEDFSGFKNSIQARGSSTTYLERYALIGALGLVTADGDRDGGKFKEEKKKDNRQTASGARWDYIKAKVLKGEVTLEYAQEHFTFSKEQLNELTEGPNSETEIVPEVDGETFKEMCKDVLSGKLKMDNLKDFHFSSDQVKSLELMQQQSEKKNK